MEPAVRSISTADDDYIYGVFQSEKSKFINETIEFNLKSSYVIVDCIEENGNFKSLKQKFYSQRPLEINSGGSCQKDVHVQSRCRWNDGTIDENYAMRYIGDYISFSIYNNRTVYRKSQPDLHGNFWFLFKEPDDPLVWSLDWQSSQTNFRGQTEISFIEPNKGFNWRTDSVKRIMKARSCSYTVKALPKISSKKRYLFNNNFEIIFKI